MAARLFTVHLFVGLCWSCFILQVTLCSSYTIQPKIWRFRGHPVAYEQATVDGADASNNRNPVVLLSGFGVGSFHQHRLLDQLLDDGKDSNSSSIDTTTMTTQHRTFYAIDYLGQGNSWPDDCNDGESINERGLDYSASTWVAQIMDFLEQVVCKTGQKVHLVGNSVGGHLAVFCAAARPDLVASVVLLNATPVWGLNLPGWSGKLPAPAIPKRIGRFLFDRIRDPRTIQAYLNNCYANRVAFDAELEQQIHNCTTGKGGHAAFASILWSPPVQVTLPSQNNDVPATFISDYYECLKHVQCPVLLLFGGKDPWCKPAFAKRMLQQLVARSPSLAAKQQQQLLEQHYVELSNVGHCPNHEAPRAVALVLQAWLERVETEEKAHKVDVPLIPSPITVQEAWGETVVQERTTPEEIPVSWMDRLATAIV